MTKEELLSNFSYNKDTGDFVWLTGRRKGKIAGTTCGYGYRRIIFKDKSYASHRLAFLYMTGEMPEVVDHKNQIRDDNRWGNLVESSKALNARNTKLHAHNTSGRVGVYYFKSRNKWRALIEVDKVRHELGLFDEFDDAVKARAEAEVKYGFNKNHGMVNNKYK